MGNEQSSGAKGEVETSFMQALLNGQVETMKGLLASNPQLIYAHTKEGQNIWHFAAQGGYVEVLKLVHQQVNQAGPTAAQKKAPTMPNIHLPVPVPMPNIAIPVGKSLAIDQPTREGITPLIVASQNGRAEAAKLLLQLGADPWQGDSSGNTAAHHAALKGNKDVLSALLVGLGDKGTAKRYANVRNSTGLTPLHMACWAGQLSCARLLLRNGANLAAESAEDSMETVICSNGSSPLHLAAMRGHADVVRLLLDLWACLCDQDAAEGRPQLPDPRTATDRYGHNPLKVATDCGKAAALAGLLDPARQWQPAGSTSRRRSRQQQQQQPDEPPSPKPAGAAPKLAAAAPEPAPEELIKAVAVSPPPAAQPPAASSETEPPPPPRSPAKRASSSILRAAAAAAAAAPPDRFLCPITFEVMDDPVVACDGCSYERAAIETWFSLGNSFFPGGHSRVVSEALRGDEVLRGEIAEWREKQQ